MSRPDYTGNPQNRVVTYSAVAFSEGEARLRSGWELRRVSLRDIATEVGPGAAVPVAGSPWSRATPIAVASLLMRSNLGTGP